MTSLSYLRDPEAIYRESFATIAREADLGRLPFELHPVAVRMIHACGMVDLINDIAGTADLAETVVGALAAGAPVFCDAEMVCAGIIRRYLLSNNEIIVTINEIASAGNTTRSAAAVDLWRARLGGAVVVIGNAPTALFRLLEMIDDGAPKPAAIIGTPVGFVGAAESKALLAENSRGIPFVTVLGRRGGSAIASAAFNAIAKSSAE